MVTPATQPQVKKLRRMARAAEVYIRVDEAGSITVDPYYAQFGLGQEVRWIADDDITWTIGFHDSRTPIGAKVVHGHGAEMDGKHTAVKEGHFAYTIAAIRQRRRRGEPRPAISLDAACPEIIIDPREN